MKVRPREQIVTIYQVGQWRTGIVGDVLPGLIGEFGPHGIPGWPRRRGEQA
jgi:hypothetical protein